MDADLGREFDTLVSESSVLAFRVAFSVLRNREEAEDVAQNAIIKAYRHFRRLRGRDRFKAWLVRIAWRLAINRARDNRRRAVREDVPADARLPATAEDIAASRELAVHVWRAIDDLPEKLRTVVVLASIEDHDVADVARLLAVPPGTVKSRLFLARKRLAETLQWIATDWIR
jgi:RNA polymerase sigma-70 factor (ECF subfamily)